MAIKTQVRKNTYFDSVSLMALSTKANQLPGVEQAVIAMGTELNKDVLQKVGLSTGETEGAGPGDLMIVVKADSDLEGIFASIDELMTKKGEGSLSQEARFSSLGAAAAQNPAANLAVISVPGAYAGREAKKALELGLHVMIFSDNVTVEEEKALKEIAAEKGLLVMGPDCGTAILSGKGLCFANEVRRGNIGIVAASGTGAQEVSVRIHDFGGGVSQLIGTGGRDLSKKVGGIMMLEGLRALEADPETEVILLLSKQPAPQVAEKIYARLRECKKPVVVCFIGGKADGVEECGIIYAKTTKEAALRAVVLAGKPEEEINTHALNLPLIEEVKAKLNPQQKYIRGLFCGGTVCEEVFHLIGEKYPNIYSNIAKDPAHKLADVNKSVAHTLIDFGDDTFTRGRPHPMIDPSIRIDRFREEARDPEVGVIALDFILGYGSHEDPAGMMLPAIREAKEKAKAEGRHLEILAFVLGTEKDPQDLDGQVAKLMAEGVTIASSSVNTGLLSRGFVEKEARA